MLKISPNLIIATVPIIISGIALLISGYTAWLQYKDRKFKIAIPIFLRAYGTDMSKTLENDSKFAININNFSARSVGIYKICFIGSDSKEYTVKNKYFLDFGQHISDTINGKFGNTDVFLTKSHNEKILKTELPIFNLMPYESKFRFFELNDIPENVSVIEVELFSTRHVEPINIKIKQQLISQKQWQTLRY